MRRPVGGEASRGVGGDRMNRTALGLPVRRQTDSAVREIFL